MPTYDYKCDKCGVFEITHSIMDDAHTKCPVCGIDELSRLISGIGGVIIGGREANQ